MEIRELEIEGAWLARSPIHYDDRGIFREWFKSSDLERDIKRKFEVVQANMSRSNLGVIRGIHFSTSIDGQGKWITCAAGSIWDVVVDIRPNSPTFRKWIGIELNSEKGDAIFISEGLGHGFIALEDNSVVTYLLTSEYSVQHEFGIHALDKDLGITWPIKATYMSTKDSELPTLREFLKDVKI